MRKQYDDFTQLKIKDMSKSISDMTYTYINPENGQPTRVPPTHYEKILDQITEKYVSSVTSRKILSIMYDSLCNLKKEDEKYFYQALLCMDLNLNPKDLRIDEQIAIEYTNEFLKDKKNYEKKNFHFLDSVVIEAFNNAKNDSELQAQVVRDTNRYNEYENSGSRHHERDER